MGSLVSQFSKSPLIEFSTAFVTSWVVNLSFVWPEKVGLDINIETIPQRYEFISSFTIWATSLFPTNSPYDLTPFKIAF